MKLNLVTFSLTLVPQAVCFTPVHHVQKWSTNTQLNAMNDKDRFEREIQEKAEINARIKAMNKNTTGSTAAGAILGGIVGGPFGALFGASIGSNLGSQSNLEKARKDEMESMGISQEMLDQAQEIGILLDRGIESLKLIEDALKTQQNFAKRLESDMDRIYADARLALQDGDEDKARDLLLKKTNLEEKLKKTLMGCVDEKKRLTQMEDNVRALEERALEMESLLKRSVGAKTLMDSSMTNLSLEREDPLLKKFKDAGLDNTWQ